GMSRDIVWRASSAVPLLLVVSLAVFLLLKLTPGAPAVIMLGQEATPAAVAQLHNQLGFDRPLPEQYLSFLWGALHGDLGRSFDTHLTVVTELGPALPATVELALAAIMFSILPGVPLGVISAAGYRSRVDHLVSLVSIPIFWLGLMLIYAFSVQWR